jgi:hypothetical protein
VFFVRVPISFLIFFFEQTMAFVVLQNIPPTTVIITVLQHVSEKNKINNNNSFGFGKIIDW